MFNKICSLLFLAGFCSPAKNLKKNAYHAW